MYASAVKNLMTVVSLVALMVSLISYFDDFTAWFAQKPTPPAFQGV